MNDSNYLSLGRVRRSALSRAAIAVAPCLMAAGCGTQLHRVLPVPNDAFDDTTSEYLYYALPRTVIVVDIIGVVADVGKPECPKTATRLGLTPPPRQGKVFTVAKVDISKRAEPDPARRYAVELDDRGTKSLALHVNALGVPAKAGSEATSSALAIATSAAKLLAPLLAKTPPSLTAALPDQDPSHCSALEADLRNVRGLLLALYSSGSAGDSKDVLAIKEAKLLKQAKTIETYFTGVKIGDPASIVCEVSDLGPSSGGPLPLITWTPGGGPKSVAAAGAGAGAAPTAKAEPVCRIPAELRIGGSAGASLHTVTLDIDAVRRVLSPLSNEEKRSASGERSFYYALPALARVSVSDTIDGALTDSVEWALPQLGTIASLPRLSAAGAIKLNVAFDPETGALTEVSTSRTAADPSALMGAITDQLTARQAAEKEQAERDVELEGLQRQQAVLESMVAIRAAEAALATPSAP